MTSMMTFLFVFGILLVAASLIIIVFCILKVWHHRRSRLGDSELREKLGKLVTINLVALCTAALGASCAVIALLLA